MGLMCNYSDDIGNETFASGFWGDLWDCDDPDLGISDDNWACGTLDVET
jgi:hypothetical protein